MSKIVDELQLLIDRLSLGDEEARDDLIAGACERLMRLTRKMLREFPSLRRWEDTDDVFQNSMLRLCSALNKVTPKDVSEFIGLSALQIRRELLDLARHYYGQHGLGTRYLSDHNHGKPGETSHQEFQAFESTLEPQRLAMWSEFHLQVDLLPDKERELFDLLWYQGIPQADVASLLGVTERTIQRQWQNVRLKVHQEMKRSLPDA